MATRGEDELSSDTPLDLLSDSDSERFGRDDAGDHDSEHSGGDDGSLDADSDLHLLSGDDDDYNDDDDVPVGGTLLES